MVSAGSFITPYLASSDNRSVVGVDCPLCKSKKRAVQLTTVPSNRAVRIFIDQDFKPKFMGYIDFHYAHPDKLPEEFYGNNQVAFWRCENCRLVFHNGFDDWSEKDLAYQIYNAEYAKTLPQSQNELPQLRLNFLRALIGVKKLKEQKIIVCESSLGGLTDELISSGHNADTFRFLAEKQAVLSHRGAYNLVCMFNLLERIPSIEDYFKTLAGYTNKETAFVVTYYSFSHKDENRSHFLAPRNGFFRLLSEKTILQLASNLKLECKILSPGIVLFYREPAAFIQDLLDNEFDHASLQSTWEEMDEDKKEDELVQITYSGNTPSEIQTQTKRIKIRDTRYGMMAYYYQDKLIGKSLDEYGQYLDADRELLEQLVRPDWSVIEAAANIGVHSLVMSSLVGSVGRVMAFEPYEMSRRLLGLNLELNARDNVSITPLALGAEEVTTRLMNFSPDNPGSLAAMGWNQRYSGVSVSQISLDSLSIERCDFMHICAPEQEPDILQGARELLENLRPALLVNCVNKSDFERIQPFLVELDYCLYWHIQPFYLEDNYFGSTRNVFDSAGAAKVLALHREKEQNVSLQKIMNVDDWVI